MVNVNDSMPGQSARRARGALPGRYFMTFRVQNRPQRREGLLKYVQRTCTIGGEDLNNLNAISARIDFDQEDYVDPEYFYSPAATADWELLKVKKQGWYEVTAMISLDNDTTSQAVTLVGVMKSTSNFVDWSTPTILHPLLGGYAYNRHSSRGEGSVKLGPAVVYLDADEAVVVAGTQVSGAGGGTAKTIANACGIQMRLLSDPNPDSGFGGRVVAEADGNVEEITISKGSSGITGTTEIDILKNGTSISNSLGFTLGWSDTFKRFPDSEIGTLTVEEGDEFTIKPIREEYQPSPLDLVVQMKVRLAG